MDNINTNNEVSVEVLNKREKVVTWIFSLLNPVITGAVMYFMWRKSHPQKAKQANKISWICFLIQAVIYGAFEAGSYFLEKRLVSKIQNQALITNEIVQNQAQIPSQPSQVAVSETANWKTYTSEKYNFEIKYPSNWAINSDRFGPNSVVFEALPSQESKQLEAEFERISNSGDMQATQNFVEQNEDALNKAIEQQFFKVTVMDNPQAEYSYESFNKNIKQGVKIQEMTIGGYQGYKYTLGENDPAPQAYVIKSGVGYLIDGIRVADIFDKALSTFKFLK
ncbi:MAG: hypothetical protein Q7R99_02715 [bacterium]|nr:hypothetical protein [bacterium]